jgi:hypothetical protein
MDTESCVACVDDNDCGGTGVCLPTGACADPTKIIHAISSGGSMMMNTCGGIGVGKACDLDTALLVARSGLGRNVIKLDDPGPYISAMNNFVVDVDIALGLTIDARNATLHHNATGAIFTINLSKGMAILGGTIEGATGGGGDGIRCSDTAVLTILGTTIRTNDESGIDASDCTLTIMSTDIQDNSKSTSGTLYSGIETSKGSITISRSQIISNRGGGIIINNGKFVIVGNVFLGNGDNASALGGVSLSTATLGDRLDFNTLADNKSQAGVAPGIQCTAIPGFMAQNNVVWDNNGPTAVQVGGGCLHAFSDIGPISIVGSSIDGGNNLSVDPMFNGPTTDLNPRAMSPIRGKANPQADLTGIASKDIAGKVRTQPADLGAYVVPAQ